MEDKKMLDIIHNNCKKEQIRRSVTKKQNKKKDKKQIIILIICIILALGLIALINKHNLDTCIKNGGNETFCRYGGE